MMTVMTTETIATVNLTIDGRAVTVPKGTTVYTATKQLGIEIPIFCYQDRMPPFGACRVCLVEVEKMAKLQTSCTLEATEGMVVRTQSDNAVTGRKGILEFLLINHPLDCPICDRGGECPLQDQALKFGPGESRFYEEKRHFTKPVPRGPVLMLDRERCIVCARCTRFGDVVAGDNALELLDRGFKTEVGTPDGGPARSKFIGNTIMICPVGALTSQVYRFRARPWDNDSTESSCTLCPVGCSLYLDSRDGEIMRTRSRENPELNDIWLCDKGWFGYEFTSHADRLQKPLIRRNGKLEPATWDEALSLIAKKIQEAKPSGLVAGLGGDPLTVEENFLFQELIRKGAGVNHIDHRVGTPIVELADEGIQPGMEIRIGESEKLSFAILCGVDLTEEFPVIWLRLKKAINDGAKVIFLGNYTPEISKHLSDTIIHAPGKELEALHNLLPQIKSLSEKGQGAFFVGSQYLNTPQRKAILSELNTLKNNSSNISLNLLEGHNNSVGARFAGMRPDLGPMGKRLEKPGLNTLQIIEKTAREGWGFLYVAGANLAKKLPSKLWDQARTKLGFLVVQDLFLTETARQADVVLPTLSYVEKRGRFINIEGHVQTLMPGKEIPKEVYSDADIFTLIALKLNFLLSIEKGFLDVLEKGKIPLERTAIQLTSPNKSVQSTGLKATFSPALFDNGVRMKHNSHVIQLAKEAVFRMHSSEASKRQIHSGDVVRISANGSSIVGKVTVDDSVALETVVVPLGFDQIPVHDLAPQLVNGLEIEIQKEQAHV